MPAGRDVILGVDPGSRYCGWGVVARVGSQIDHVDNGVICLEQHGPLPSRLGILLTELLQIIDTYRPSFLGIEGVFQHRNARSALVLGHARGVAIAAAASRGIEVQEYAPMQVKKGLTGSGRAKKAQMQQMVGLRMGLSDVPQEDAADALAVAICHAQHLGLPPTAEILMPAKRSKRSADAALMALVRAQEENRR